MRVDWIELNGYGSFAASGRLLLKSGMNLIVGENNSGKSTLLRSLSPILDDNRHRGLSEFRSERLTPPNFQAQMAFSGQEFVDAMLRENLEIRWPIREQSDVPGLYQTYISAPFLTALIRRGPGAAFTSVDARRTCSFTTIGG